MNERDFGDEFERQQGIYLLSHSVGLLPKSTRSYLEREFLDVWRLDAANVWPHWLAQVEAYRAALGDLLNSSPACFCPQTNLSSALIKILSALPVPNRSRAASKRPVVLLSEEDFPSVGFVLAKAAALGYQLRFMASTCDTSDSEVWRRHLRGDVGLMVITHVQSNTSRQVPVGEIVAMARANGVVSVVDVAQSVGVVPIDVDAWGADFVLGSCVKWLCGGPGAGFMWVHPARLDTCEPTDVGWFSHAEPFELDIHDFRYADDALRFWGGTPSVSPFVSASNAIRLMLRIGPNTVRAHNLELSARLIQAVDPAWLRSPLDTGLRGGTVVLHFGERHREVAERLERAGVNFDQRAHGIRISPHIYNTAEEIELIIELLGREGDGK